MKTLFLLCLACFSVEASHYQSSMAVKPLGNEFLLEMEIEKISDEGTTALVASPKLICVQGKSAELKLESEECFLSVHALVSENAEIQTSVFLKENGLVVLSLDNKIKMMRD